MFSWCSFLRMGGHFFLWCFCDGVALLFFVAYRPKNAVWEQSPPALLHAKLQPEDQKRNKAG